MGMQLLCLVGCQSPSGATQFGWPLQGPSAVPTTPPTETEAAAAKTTAKKAKKLRHKSNRQKAQQLSNGSRSVHLVNKLPSELDRSSASPSVPAQLNNQADRVTLPSAAETDISAEAVLDADFSKAELTDVAEAPDAPQSPEVSQHEAVNSTPTCTDQACKLHEDSSPSAPGMTEQSGPQLASLPENTSAKKAKKLRQKSQRQKAQQSRNDLHPAEHQSPSQSDVELTSLDCKSPSVVFKLESQADSTHSATAVTLDADAEAGHTANARTADAMEESEICDAAQGSATAGSGAAVQIPCQIRQACNVKADVAIKTPDLTEQSTPKLTSPAYSNFWPVTSLQQLLCCPITQVTVLKTAQACDK